MKIAICDDCQKDAENIKHLLENPGIFEISDISIFLSGDELISQIDCGTRFDIVFLDVEMPDKSGIEVGKSIRRHDRDAIIIFVTSYPEFAIDAYECEAFNYLLKPCNPEKLYEVTSRAVSRLGLLNKYHIVKIRNQTIRIPISDIYYIECQRKHILYHLKNETIETTDKLSAVYDALCNYGFCQVHQGYIVNMEKIKGFDKYSVSIKGLSVTLFVSNTMYFTNTPRYNISPFGIY